MDELYYLDREMDSLEALLRYQQRMLRWSLLKAWWEAQRRLSKANTQADRVEAIRHIQGFKAQYSDTLTEALKLWDMAQSYKHRLGLTQQQRHMNPGEPDIIWEDSVLNRE